MTFPLFPLDPRTPIADAIPDVPSSLIGLPQRVRSRACLAGDSLACQDARCLCTCHAEPSSSWPGFHMPARNHGFGDVERVEGMTRLFGARGPFRFAFAGEPRPATLAELLGAAA